MIKNIFRIPITLALPALLLLAGCNPAIFKKGAFSVDDWETWTSWNDAFGEHNVSSSRLAYRLSANQDDTQDMPFDGRSPGLILSKTVAGRDWRVEVSPKFKVPPGALKRVSFGMWVGREGSRPSLGSPAAALKLLAQRQNGPAPEDDVLIVSAPPVKDSPVKIPKETKTLRFEKSGGYFFISYSLDGQVFTRALRAESAEGSAAESQKFFVSGRADGSARGAWAEFYGLKISGQ